MTKGAAITSPPVFSLSSQLYRYGQIICSLLLAIIFHNTSLAQGTEEVLARILDSASLEPVPFATVYITELSGTIADETGFFRIQVAPAEENDTLHISCVGYLGKDIPLREMSHYGLDSIYLSPHIFELDEVGVQVKAGRAPKARDIIRLAISNIPENYPDTSILYNGYYREYIKQEDQYINLFESIINLEDQGFGTVDNFNAGLMFKRINQDFRVDSLLMRPYDNRDKFVPYSLMPIPLNNELVILRAHDPVRNFNRESLYFIECLQKDFIRNHEFSPARLTYLGDRPFYFIAFVDNRKYTIGISRITTRGVIYIDALNYGIKKINYRATTDNGTIQQKLFELSLEYRLVDSTYLLHYLSFNNLFKTRNLQFTSSSIYDDKLRLFFSKSLNPQYADNSENISVYLEDKEQEIQKIELENYSMLLTFSEHSALSDRLKINLLPRNITTRKKIADNEKYLFENIQIDFRDFRDLQGNEISTNEFNEYYQYREFFTSFIFQDQNGITSNLIDKTKPVIENRIFWEQSVDTTWLNTPLIEENVAGRKIFSGNPALNRFIESLYTSGENSRNDILYIHTDREVYAPEDTVWFKTYIRNRKYLTGSGLSKTFDILLVSTTGRIIKQEKYLTGEEGMHGQIVLDNTLEDGIYCLAGYSSWMKNFDVSGLYSKKIMVMRDRQENLHLAATFDKQDYFPGDTVKILVNCYDEMNRRVDDVAFSYRTVSGRKMPGRGSGNTSFSWMEPLSLVIPFGLDTIPVIEFKSTYKSLQLDTTISIPVNYSLHVGFFPEGGYCTNGMETNVAFKAVTGNGNPVEIEGEVISQDGQVNGQASSVHEGMGVFPFRPQENKAYFFRVVQPAGLSLEFPLPAGSNEGWLLQLKKDNKEADYLEVEISNINTDNDTAILTLSVRGFLCWYDVIKAGKRKTIRIPTGDIPPGVAVLTLFDNKMMPRAERLVYIFPGNNVAAVLQTDRQRYVPRDSVRLAIRLTSDRPLITGGSYSLSVVDDQLCSSPLLEEPGILSSLLLSPEIRGTINNADHYLDLSDNDAARDLNLLLMTQGWRNYEYLAKGVDSVNIIKPQNRDAISGHLMKRPFGGESRPTDGSLTVYIGGSSAVIPVKQDGAFSFIPDYSSYAGTGIFLYAEDRNKRSNLSIILDSSAFESNLQDYLSYLADSLGRVTPPPVAGQYRLQDYFSLSLENHQWLEEVIIRKTVKKKELSTVDLAFSKRKADQEELDMAVFMEDLEYVVRKSNPDSMPVYYCIDGILQYTLETGDGRGPPVRIPDYSYAYNIKPEQVAEYTVIRGPEVQALYGYGIEYVIDVKTKPLSEQEVSRRRENPVRIEKFAVAKEFYRPVYDTDEKRSSTIPDLRKTIHWEPELHLAEDGTAQVQFYNGDRYTRIRCILEGITGDGIPVQAEHFYEVMLTGEE